jgi:hypothetical protein
LASVRVNAVRRNQDQAADENRTVHDNFHQVDA